MLRCLATGQAIDNNAKVVIATVLAIVIMAGVLLGNTCYLMILRAHKGMRTRCNLYLGNLAANDLVLSSILIPLIITSWWTCKYNNTKYMAAVTSAHWTVTSCTQLSAVGHKLLTTNWPGSRVAELVRTTCPLLISITWLLAILVLVFMLNGVVNQDWPISVMLILPCPFTFGCLVFMLLSDSGIRRETADQVKDPVHMYQYHIVVTLMLVSGSFLLLQILPYLVITTVLHNQHSFYKVVQLINCVGYLTNPVIYYWRSASFKQGVCLLFRLSRTKSCSPENPGASLQFQSTQWRQYQSGIEYSALDKGIRYGAEPLSRKASMATLLTSSKCRSTNSLPGNFLYGLAPLHDNNTATKVTLIGGVPVLVKNGKIVCYRDPNDGIRFIKSSLDETKNEFKRKELQKNIPTILIDPTHLDSVSVESMELEVQIDVLAPRHSIESGFVEAELSDLSITTRSPRPLTPPAEEDQQRPPSPSSPHRTQLPPLLKRLFSTKRQPLGRQRAARSTIKKQRPMTGYELAKAVSDTCLSRPRPQKGGDSVSGNVSRRQSRRPSVEQLDAGLVKGAGRRGDGGEACVITGVYPDLDSGNRRHSYQPHKSRCLSVADFDCIENYTQERLNRAHSEPCILTPVFGAFLLTNQRIGSISAIQRCGSNTNDKLITALNSLGDMKRELLVGQTEVKTGSLDGPEVDCTLADVHLLDIPVI